MLLTHHFLNNSWKQKSDWRHKDIKVDQVKFESIFLVKNKSKKSKTIQVIHANKIIYLKLYIYKVITCQKTIMISCWYMIHTMSISYKTKKYFLIFKKWTNTLWYTIIIWYISVSNIGQWVVFFLKNNIHYDILLAYDLCYVGIIIEYWE